MSYEKAMIEKWESDGVQNQGIFCSVLGNQTPRNRHSSKRYRHD